MSNEACRIALDEGALRVKVEKVESRVGGDDTVENDGAITATTTSLAAAGGVGVTIEGETSVGIKSSADSRSAAVDLGGGNDQITNVGTLAAHATSSAFSLDVGVAVPGDASAESKPKVATDGGATATSVAVGLAGDSVSGDASSVATVEFLGTSLTDITSHRLQISQTETRANGNDAVINQGRSKRTRWRKRSPAASASPSTAARRQRTRRRRPTPRPRESTSAAGLTR